MRVNVEIEEVILQSEEGRDGFAASSANAERQTSRSS